MGTAMLASAIESKMRWKYCDMLRTALDVLKQLYTWGEGRSCHFLERGKIRSFLADGELASKDAACISAGGDGLLNSRRMH